MSRPSTIDNAAILEIARRLFLERGSEVPTAEIARAAGISEGSIYKRFRTKQALFMAAMGFESPAWVDELVSRVGQRTVQANLRKLIREGIAFFDEMMPRIMLMWSQRTQAGGNFRGPAGPVRLIETITAYLAGECALGRVRCHSPEVTARMVLAAIANYTFFRTVGLAPKTAPDPEAYAAQVIETLWRGISPATDADVATDAEDSTTLTHDVSAQDDR